MRQSESESKFIRNSERFQLTGAGDVNTYAVFAELARGLIGKAGRAGIIVPSGIATDFTYKDFFASIVDQGNLISLYDFENREGLFAGVHREQKFCLLTLSGQSSNEIDFAFFLTQTNQLRNFDRSFTLSREDLELINPNTKTCPIFRTKRDAELTRKLYREAPVLVNEVKGANPWDVAFLRMFDMTNDSHLFQTRMELEDDEFELCGNRFHKRDEFYLPLYEGKLTQIYDHRFGTFAELSTEETERGSQKFATNEDHQSDRSISIPRFWVNQSDFLRVLPQAKLQPFWLTFHGIANPNNERTFIAAICPATALGNSLPAIIGLQDLTPKASLLLLGNFNSIILDYVARKKIGSRNMNFFIVTQLPVHSLDRYTLENLNFISPRVLELTYTAWDIKAFADDLWRETDVPLRAALKQQWDENVAETDGGHADAEPPSWAEMSPDGFPYPPFKWDEERRARLRAELDAIYAHLYGLTRDELDYILETFPIVKRKDIEKYSSYRTKELILKYYDEYVGKISKQEGE